MSKRRNMWRGAVGVLPILFSKVHLSWRWGVFTEIYLNHSCLCKNKYLSNLVACIYLPPLNNPQATLANSARLPSTTASRMLASMGHLVSMDLTRTHAAVHRVGQGLSVRPVSMTVATIRAWTGPRAWMGKLLASSGFCWHSLGRVLFCPHLIVWYFFFILFTSVTIPTHAIVLLVTMGPTVRSISTNVRIIHASMAEHALTVWMAFRAFAQVDGLDQHVKLRTCSLILSNQWI